MNRTEDRRVRKTKKNIQDTFLILLSKKSIKDISVKELADLADINRGTFYFHYRDIYHLQEEIETKLLKKITTILEKLPQDNKDDINLFDILFSFNSFLYENSEIYNVLFSNNSFFSNKLVSIVREEYLIDWLSKHYPAKNIDDINFFIDYVISGFIAVSTRWLNEGFKISTEEFSRKTVDLILSSLDLLNEKK